LKNTTKIRSKKIAVSGGIRMGQGGKSEHLQGNEGNFGLEIMAPLVCCIFVVMCATIFVVKHELQKSKFCGGIMTSLLIIAAAAAAAIVIALLCAILYSAIEIERLLGEILDESCGRCMADDDTPFEEEEGGALEQRRWEEGVANLLSYMGGAKGGDLK
jgi:hypothetical protein